MNFGKILARVVRVLLLLVGTYPKLNAIPALQRRHGLLAFLSLAFFVLFLVGGSYKTQFAPLDFPLAALMLVVHAINRTRSFRIAPFLFVSLLVCYAIVVLTLRQYHPFKPTGDVYSSIYQTPWNIFIFTSCLVLFLSLKRILITMCICFVILIGHQSFIAAYFNDSALVSSVRAGIFNFSLLFCSAIIFAADQRELKTYADKVKSMFDLSREALVVHDSGIVLDINSAFEKMFKIERQKIVDTRVASFLPEFDIKSGSETETVGLDASGSKFLASVVASSGRYHKNDLASVLSIVDITTRQKLMEADIAIRKADAANEAKGLFLANMTHELRTPINGVLASVEVLEKTELSASQREFLGYVRISADTLLDLITDILDFSKIEAGRLELDPSTFNMLYVLEECFTIVCRGAFDKGLEVAVFIDPQLYVMLIGDRKRWKQILLNLMSNAIKFTKNGQVIVRVWAGEHKGNDEVEIFLEVQDSGIGIRESDINNLFSVFTQVDASSTRGHAGTGLGLSIVKRLCVLMGGNAEVRSEYGQGSTFRCCAVLGIAPNSPKCIDIGTSVGQEIKGHFQGKQLVAVTNDPNEHVRKSVVQQLGMIGIDCIEIPDTPQFIQYLEEAPDDRVVLGCTKLEKMSERLRLRHVILSTNYYPVFDSATPVIHKPVTFLRLVNSLFSNVDLRLPPNIAPLLQIFGLAPLPMTSAAIGPTPERHTAKLGRYASFVLDDRRLSSSEELRPSSATKNIAGVESMARSGSEGCKPRTNTNNDPREHNRESSQQNSSENKSEPKQEVEVKPQTRSRSRTTGAGMDQVASADVLPTSFATPAGNARILIVEDNFVNYKVFARWLNDAGYTTSVANNGIEALEALKKDKFDIIFMDCQMPLMDGFECTKRIREDEKESNSPFRIPIVALTANALQAELDKCIEVGMDSVILKPVKKRELLFDKVEQHMRAKEQRDNAQAQQAI